METIVIIGGGFAGLTLAKKLDKRFRVKIIDRNNFHSFPPLFYQIASSSLPPADILFPFRREFKGHENVSYHMGHVKNIDIENNTVTTSYETIPYDILVIAAGSKNNYFGNDELAKETFGIKTANEAMHTRDEILDRLERAAISEDKERRRKLLSFVVVGGGPTGVEIAGALGEMKKYIVPKEYRELDADDLKITLVEGSGSLLGAMGEKSGKKAVKYLNDLMVDVRLNTLVKEYKDKIVTYGDGSQEYVETIIWTAGVCGETMPGLPSDCVGRGGRISTDTYCKVKGLDNVYAIGDIAMMQTDDYPKGHPQVAPVAIQQAGTLARNLNNPSEAREFKYHDKGSMATVGKNRAVVAIGKTFLSGFIAWLTWMLVHLMSILGMRNKISVFFNWIWNYFSRGTSLRLLLRPTKFPLRKHWAD